MESKTKKKAKKTKKGSALLLTTVLLFIILGMVVSLTYVTVMEQKMSSKTKSSVGSFYSAESGIEWALNKIATTSAANPIISDAFPGFSQGKTTCPSGFDCEVWLLDQNGKVITDSITDLSEVKAVRSIGTQGNETTRAIEAAVAAGGNGTYIRWGSSSCGSDTLVYSGIGASYIYGGTSITGVAGTICWDQNQPSMPNDNTSIGIWWGTGDKYSAKNANMPCAVCAR